MYGWWFFYCFTQGLNIIDEKNYNKSFKFAVAELRDFQSKCLKNQLPIDTLPEIMYLLQTDGAKEPKLLTKKYLNESIAELNNKIYNKKEIDKELEELKKKRKLKLESIK